MRQRNDDMTNAAQLTIGGLRKLAYIQINKNKALTVIHTPIIRGQIGTVI